MDVQGMILDHFCAIHTVLSHQRAGPLVSPTCGAMPYLPTILQMRAGSLQLCLSQYSGTCNINNKVSLGL